MNRPFLYQLDLNPLMEEQRSRHKSGLELEAQAGLKAGVLWTELWDLTQFSLSFGSVFGFLF